jgi:TPR repeat protein
MTDQDKLPAKVPSSGQLILPKERTGSPVSRGLEAVRSRQELKLDVSREEADPTGYRKAAEQGDAEAQLNLGWEYLIGELVRANGAEAFEWWHKSAEQGCIAAQNSLGCAYSFAEEYVTAYFWLGLARDSTSDVGPKVIYNSSYRNQDYISTLKTPMQIAEDIEALLTPSEMAEVEYSIGEAYHDGDGMPQNDAQAIRWWMRAAERGYRLATYALVSAYTDDESVHEDYIKAYMWFCIGEEWLGVGREFISFTSEFVRQTGYLQHSLTPEEIGEAKRLAREWIESHAS